MTTWAQTGREVLRSADPAESNARLADLFSPHRLDPMMSRGNDFLAVARAARVGSIDLVYLKLGAEAVVDPEPLGTYYNINILLSGRASVVHGNDHINASPSCAPVLRPTSPVSMRWSADCTQLAVKIDRLRLEQLFAETFDKVWPTELPLNPVVDANQRRGRCWLRIIKTVVSDLNDGPDVSWNSQITAKYEDLILTGLLVAQLPEIGLTNPRLPAPGVVREAVEFMHTHADQAITTAVLAARTGVSVRSLQQGFNRYLGTTPMRYLQTVRLDRAHADLVQARGDVMTRVEDVAYRWGFAHAPRFAAMYRRRFGINPSQTLHGRYESV
ncbi:AraC family transcriptional regulator [Rhodococcus sp. ACS1]|uniref:AraC family transcriptional regulator n=1 Tax=Rhodococcus sp. ACS1 TaxID=2028570 RepID=UPI0015C7D646|nr:AraC family transcriptional regulator [Rhodococcus sp. ACS1]